MKQMTKVEEFSEMSEFGLWNKCPPLEEDEDDFPQRKLKRRKVLITLEEYRRRRAEKEAEQVQSKLVEIQNVSEISSRNRKRALEEDDGDDDQGIQPQNCKKCKVILTIQEHRRSRRETIKQTTDLILNQVIRKASLFFSRSLFVFKNYIKFM